MRRSIQKFISVHQSRFVRMYSSSTFLRAHSVLRKNVRLDFMEGLLLKQLMFIWFASVGHPLRSTKKVRIASKVLPCKGSIKCALRVKVIGNTPGTEKLTPDVFQLLAFLQIEIATIFFRYSLCKTTNFHFGKLY